MNKIAPAAFIAFALTMLLFAQIKGYVPVSFPKYRVYRNGQPAYFWTLIASYALILAMGIFILVH